MHTKEEILAFINDRRHISLSTINSNDKPESAIVGFGQTDDFQIVFGTKDTSRKYKNLLNNPNVSVIIGWDHAGTVQYEGVARKLEGDEIDIYTEVHFSKHPNSRQYKDHPDEVYFLIEPKWLRFTEVAFDPWRITELTF